MTKPQLERMKFWIVKPKAGINQIKNPIFSPPDHEQDWSVHSSSGSATIEVTGDEQRFGAYCMKITPNPGDNYTNASHDVSITNGDFYTFSAYVKGTDGDTWQVGISDGSFGLRANTTFVTTGYWQRVEVTHEGTENASNYKVLVRTTTADNPIYVDGVQFEQASAATTLMEGYMPGCRWESYARNSKSIRSAQHGLGGELLDISDYARILSVHGLGMGDWNQVMTKMTSGGDMYQTHIRKSRNFSMVLAYTGDNQGDMQANRKVIIDALRPDYLFGGLDERRVIRYQGFDENGQEATNPVDIVCVFQPSHTDTPSLPVFQKDVLNFSVPSGLFQGAYNEGKVLDLYAEFPAEYIVKRDPNGNWCKWNGTGYDNSLKGQGTVQGLNGPAVCIAEGPDGKIYVGGDFTNAGGVVAADYLARWNPTTEAWESVIAGISSSVETMAFDANGDLYVGGSFTNLGSPNGDNIVKLTDLNGTPTVNALGTGLNSECRAIVVSPDGNVFVGGLFTSAGSVLNTSHIAKWDGAAWSALSTGLNNNVLALAFAPNGDLYIGGMFTNADGTYGDYLCYWDGTAFKRVGTVELNDWVQALAFAPNGDLYIGGAFTNAGGVASADYIAKWSGSKWESLGTGTNYPVYHIFVNSGKVYAAGNFTSAGGLTLTDRVAVWANGSWMPLDINLPGTTTCRGLFVSLDGSLYIGGVYSTAVAGENAETGIVALNLNVSSASANTYPFMQVRGPGTLKAITNYTTGKSVMFDGLTLQAGEWINLYFDPLNLKFQGGWSGRGNLMRYVVPGSDYGDFYLKPGNNLISLFFPDSDENLGSGAFMSWTPLFWGIDGALL